MSEFPDLERGDKAQRQGMENGRAPPPARKIMVVADPSRESAAALQYALSHAVVEQDELILLHIENTSTSWKNTFSSFLRLPSSHSYSTSASFHGGGSSAAAAAASALASEISQGQGQGDGYFLEQMKRLCEIAQPKVRVRAECMPLEGSKANTILLLSERLGIDVIIIGQRRTLSSAILGYVFLLSLFLCRGAEEGSKRRLRSQLKDPQELLAPGMTSAASY